MDWGEVMVQSLLTVTAGVVDLSVVPQTDHDTVWEVTMPLQQT
jgi:hypothetical protein